MKPNEKESVEAHWIWQNRSQLQRIYGAGTFLAVFDYAVIDWGDDADAVKARAQALMRDSVYVASVPSDIDDERRYDTKAYMSEYERYRAMEKANPDRRRYRFDLDAFEALEELGILGKAECYEGIIEIDGDEKRFSDRDFRLMQERDIIPKETELIAGIVFRIPPQRGPAC